MENPADSQSHKSYTNTLCPIPLPEKPVKFLS